MTRWFRHWIFLLVLLPIGVQAGGGPLNTLVVVNSANRNSRALGAFYAEQHGIPPSHLCTIKVNSRSPTISLEAFERDVRAPILQHIAKQGLTGQIHYLVLCMDNPTRVNNDNGITSALFYGYKAKAPDAPRCNIAPDSDNQYFAAEMAYTATAGWNRTNTPIAFILTAADMKTAKHVVRRGSEAQASHPKSVYVLGGSGDGARNIRHHTYSAVARQLSLLGRRDMLVTDAAASPVPEQPVIGYLTGLAYFPSNFNELVFAPGAIADHVTSCGGMLPDPCYNQSSVWDWLRLGATASYGTVFEPCAYQKKFPDPMIAFWYSRGFTAGEALAMSVHNPYQGIWVGDPLAAPFATPPAVEIRSPTRNMHLDGDITLSLALSSHPDGAPPVYLDLYLDGRHHTPIARPLAPVGNEVSVQIGPDRYSYTIAPGEDLFAATAGLAWAINTQSRGKVIANAKADRMELSTAAPLDDEGNPLPLSVSAEQGFAPALYIGITAGTTNLVMDGQTGRAAVALHLGSARSYELEYPFDLSGLSPGAHTLTLVVRDGTAVQCQSQATLPFIIPPRR